MSELKVTSAFGTGAPLHDRRFWSLTNQLKKSEQPEKGSYVMLT